jgi:hypothetical protein
MFQLVQVGPKCFTSCCDICRFFQCILNMVGYALTSCKFFFIISTITCIWGLNFDFFFLVTNILQLVSMILTYQLLQIPCVVMSRVLVTRVQIPPRWLKVVVTFKFLTNSHMYGLWLHPCHLCYKFTIYKRNPRVEF